VLTSHQNTIRIALMVALLVVGCARERSLPVKEESPSPMKLLIRGNALREAGDKEAAVAAYTEALALDPTFDSAYYNRAAVLVALERDQEAMADCEALSKMSSPLGKQLRAMFLAGAAGHVSIGNHAFESGDLDEALKQYRKAAIFDPASPDPHLGQGIVFAKKDELDRAVEAYDRAIQLAPRTATAYHNRAITWIKKAEYMRAIEDLAKAIEIEPGQPAHFEVRADAHEFLDDMANAARDRAHATRLKNAAK
jgi:tetratricopeptide (TPR) repeat protein